MTDIYINDLGIINALGRGKKQVLEEILKGKRSTVDRDVDGITYSVAYWGSPGKEDRMTGLLTAACDEIGTTVESLAEKYGRNRIGVVVGSTDNGTEQSFRAYKSYMEKGCFPEDYRLEKQLADFPADYIRKYFGLNSLSMAVSTACTSSAGALIAARNWLNAGVVDAVVAGGADIVSDSVLKGFISLEAVDASPTIPFSRNRKGINLGEGAALLVLTREQFGQEAILLTGCGETSDAYHMTAPDPEGRGAAEAMRQALAESGRDTVDYINLHGTGTIYNDAMEARATEFVFEKIPPVSSTKGMIGHTLGAAGAMELGICWLLLSTLNHDNRLPPHLWDGNPDPEIPGLPFAETGAAAKRLNSCMSNSYAFGGSNVSLVIERGEG